MDKTICGIDVSKDRLDVAVRPSGEHFVVARNGVGLDDLVRRLKVLRPDLIVLEATGGFETVIVAGLAAPTCRSQSPTRHRSAPLPRPSVNAPRQIRSMPTLSPISARRPALCHDRCRTKPPSSLQTSSPAGVRSST